VNTRVRLVAFAVVLAVVFGGGFALGQAAGDGDRPPDAPVPHGAEHR
jgi:hypothetical protein